MGDAEKSCNTTAWGQIWLSELPTVGTADLLQNAAGIANAS